MTTARTNLSERRHPAIVALTAMVIGILTVVLGVSGTHRAVGAPQQEGTVSLALVLGDHGALAVGDPLTGTVEVHNDSADPLTAAQVTLELGHASLPDPAAVSIWLANGTASGTFEGIFMAPTAAAAGAQLNAAVVVPSARLTTLAAGVYPVRATLSGPDAVTTAVRSVLTIRSGIAAQTGILVPITATPASGTLLDAAELTALTATDGALTAQLDAVAGTTAVLAVDPAIPAAIRALGTTAPAGALAWLARLEALPNERFALRFGDADATTQARAGLQEPLEPTTLDTFIDPENIESVDTSPAPTPTTSATPGPETPTLGEFTAIAGATPGMLWPRGEVTVADLATFDGYVGTPAITVLPSSSVSGAGANARVGAASVLVTDSTLSELLSRAATETTLGAREALLAQATAQLQFAGAPASGLLIGLDRDETRTTSALRAVIETSGARPLSALRAMPVAPVRLSTTPADARAAALTQLLEDEKRLGDFATILEDPQLLLAPERIRILRLLAVGIPDPEFDERYAVHRDETAGMLDAVAIQDYSGTIQLISANVDLPVWIRNDLPWPVDLTLEVRPSDPRIDIDPYTQITAQASSNTKTQVPVAARIASGELDVRFSLSSPTGVPIGEPKTAGVAVRAEWETIGLAGLGAIIVLLIGFGIARTVRRRRSERADASDKVES